MGKGLKRRGRTTEAEAGRDWGLLHLPNACLSMRGPGVCEGQASKKENGAPDV